MTDEPPDPSSYEFYERLDQLHRRGSSGARGYLTTGEAAAFLGVEQRFLRRFIREGALPPGEQFGFGRRRRVGFTPDWLAEAAYILRGGTDRGRFAVSAPTLFVPERLLVVESGPRFAFEKLLIDADLDYPTPSSFTLFFASLAVLFDACAQISRVGDGPRDDSTPSLVIASMSLASPLHVAAAAAAGEQAASAAKSTADALEVAATLGPRRKKAKADASVAEQTIAAHVTIENAAARKALAEALSAEERTRQDRLATLREIAELAKSLQDEELVMEVREALRQLVNFEEVPPQLAQRVAISATAVASQTRSLQASYEHISTDEG